MRSQWPRTDLHLHATRYRLDGARQEMSVSNIVRCLEDRSYTAAGIVEHLDTQPKHPVHCLEALVAESRSLSSALELFVGAELDYQEGAITVPQAPAIKQRLGLDYYLAAAHGVPVGTTSAGAYIEDQHRRLMGILACETVDIVAHPWAEGHGHARRGRIEGWRFEWIPERYLREFIDAARHHGKAIEINYKAAADASDPAFGHYLEMLCQAGVTVTLGSDAHSLERVDSADVIAEIVRNAGLDPARLWVPERSSSARPARRLRR